MIWKDRVKQYPHRYALTHVSGSTYDFAEVTGEVTEAGTPVNAENLNAIGKEINSRVRAIKELSRKINAKKPLDGTWSVKNWTGLTNLGGGGIWTDGINIYWSNGPNQYVLDVATSTWSVKTWTGLTSFFGAMIWTDGTNIYYSNLANQYVLDVATSTWSPKNWTGYTGIDGEYIWTDGINIYYSNGPDQYVLDVATSTWSVKTWTGLTSLSGIWIWTDGINIYCSMGPNQYVLDVATSTWSPKNWTGYTGILGNGIWTDGINIYYSNGPNQYVLDVATSTWSVKTWTGLTSLSGIWIWTDGINIYYSMGPNQYVLIPSKSIRNWGNPSTIDDLRGINVSVLTSAWAADATYTAYPYRAAVTVTGLTANHTGLINFNDTSLSLGTLKDSAKTYAGGFYIYASAVPSVTVTIESYVFWEV